MQNFPQWVLYSIGTGPEPAGCNTILHPISPDQARWPWMDGSFIYCVHILVQPRPRSRLQLFPRPGNSTPLLIPSSSHFLAVWEATLGEVGVECGVLCTLFTRYEVHWFRCRDFVRTPFSIAIKLSGNYVVEEWSDLCWIWNCSRWSILAD